MPVHAAPGLVVYFHGMIQIVISFPASQVYIHE